MSFGFPPFRLQSSASSRSSLSHRVVRFCLGLSLVCSISAALAQGVTFPGQTPTGVVSAPQTITVTVQKAGQASAVRVLGQGIANMDFQGTGAGTCSTSLSYTPGQTCTVEVTFHPAYPGLRQGAVVLAAADGSALGTTFLSATATGPLGVFIPGQMVTVAGEATWIYSGDGGAATGAAIFLPYGIAVDSAGNLFIADSGNNRIRKVTASSGAISTVIGNGILGFSGDGGLATQAQLSGPSSVALDGAGNLYLCDSGNNVVRKFVPSTGIITTVAGMAGRTGYTGDGGPATAATFNAPNGLSIDVSGNIYIADTANHAVRRIDAVTGILTTVAGTGNAGFNGDNIPARTAQLNAPWSVTADARGNLYIADQGNHRVRMVNPAGTISTIAGNGHADFSGDGGPATKATINAPASIAIDVTGNLYLADAGNNRVRKVYASDGTITTIAGTISQSISGDGGPATMAGLYGPYTLALDGTGSLYIADVFHNRVRMVQANQAMLTYDPIRIGRVSAPKFEMFENDGNAPLTLSSVLSISHSVVDPATTCGSGLVLQPFDTCKVGASFAPTSLGMPVVGSISLASDATNAPGTLELSGNVLSQDPSTVTVGTSANPIEAGSSVFFTVTVTSPGVIPTGNVTLYDGTLSLGSATLTAGGVATLTIPNLSPGQHTITASYEGDNNNTAGVSAALVETVQLVSAPTKTTLTSSLNPALAGTSITLSAAVSVVTNGTGVGAISGPVTFADGPTIIGAASVVNGVASLTLSTLPAGAHSIVASYAGIPAYGQSSSAALSLTVQPGTTSTQLSSSANPAVGGAKLQLTATVTGNGTAPTGMVTFMDGAATLGSATLGKSGTAVLALATPLSVATHNLVAVFAGDTYNNGSTSAILGEVVALAQTTPVVTSSQSPAPQGAAVTLTASVGSNGGIPTGKVELFDGSTSLGIATLDATGTGAITTRTLALGNHTITAKYAGDALDGASTSPALQVQIIAATSTITFNASANPVLIGSPVSFTVSVLGTGPQPTGTVTLQDGTAVLGVQTLDSTGAASFPNMMLAFGSHALTALYSGDSVHNGNQAQLTERVLQATSTVLGSSSASSIAGTQVSWTASVNALSNQPLTGSVQFKDGNTVIATVAVAANATATFNSSTLGTGSHTMTAVYSGDNLNQASTSNPLVESVALATTSTTLASSANPVYAGASLSLVAAVTGNGATPGGSVTFRDGNTVLSVLPLTAAGNVTVSLSTLTPGTHTLSATYAGDIYDGPSTSSAIIQSVVQQTTLTATSSANPAMYENPVVITVNVAGGLAAYPATGAVTLRDGSSVIATANVDATGTAKFTLTAPSLGQHPLTASYAGDVNNSPAVSPMLTQGVILRPTTNNFVTNSTSLSSGQFVTFISLVQGVGPNFPTGTVTFVSGSTVLGNAALNAQGLATLTFQPPQGSFTVVAQYPGDTLFAATSSTPTTVIVGPPLEFAINSTPSAVSVVSGGHQTLALSLTTAATFVDTVQLGCVGLPAYATCTFSSDNVKVTGGSTTMLSVVVDTGTPLAAGPATAQADAPRGTALVCMLPGGTLLALLFFRVRRFRRQLSLLAMLLLLGASAVLSGCASSLSVQHTPTGSYTFQIVGKGSLSGATQSQNIALTVTQ